MDICFFYFCTFDLFRNVSLLPSLRSLSIDNCSILIRKVSNYWFIALISFWSTLGIAFLTTFAALLVGRYFSEFTALIINVFLFWTLYRSAAAAIK